MRLLSFFLLLFLTVAGLNAQSGCSTFFLFEKGVEREYATFDKKGKLEGTIYHKVTAIEESDAGLTATVEMRMTDEKGKAMTEGQYAVECKGNILHMDVSSMLPSEMTSAFTSMDVEVSGTAMQMPSELSVGQELPDATTKIKAGANGMNLMTMTVTIANRKVEAKEKVETPAGVFDAYKITYTTNSKMLISKSFDSADWYAEGVGIVRSETYKNNGKLESSMELQRFEKN